jgi:hypothetical protein
MNTPTPSPRPAPAPHESAGTLWGKLAESVFSYVIGFVLATMLVGGGGYLLFNAKSEELALEREKLHFSASTKEDALAYEMVGFYKSTGSSETNPLMKTAAVIQRLAVERLDDAFVIETYSWISASVSRMADQIGTINGYTFSDALYKDLQRDYLNELDAEKKLLSDVGEIVNDWNKLSLERRKERIGRASNKVLEIRTAQAQIESRSHQVMKELIEKVAEDRQKNSEIDNQLTIITRKKRMAKIGVGVGITLVLTTIAMSLFRKFLKTSSA